jgi:hypothetical protein
MFKENNLISYLRWGVAVFHTPFNSGWKGGGVSFYIHSVDAGRKRVGAILIGEVYT